MPAHAIVFADLRSLAETDVLLRQAVEVALSEMSEAPIDAEAFARIAETDPAGALSDQYGPALAERAMELFRDRIAEIGLTPRPGVAEVMSAAEAGGVRLALVSGLDAATTDHALSQFTEIERGHFARVVTTGDATGDAAFARIAETLDAAPADLVAIAGAPASAAAARAAGIAVIAVPAAPYRGASFEGAERTERQLSGEMLGLPRPD